MLTSHRSNDLIALILFLADGRVNADFIRRTLDDPIHRGFEGVTTPAGPPQRVLDFNEQREIVIMNRA